MTDDLSPSLDDLADPKEGSRLSDYARQSMTHATPQEPPKPEVYHPWTQQIPGTILQHLADLAAAGPRIAGQTAMEGYHGVFPTDEEMSDRARSLATYANVGGMPFAPRATPNLLGTLRMVPDPKGVEGEFSIVNDLGKKLGHIVAQETPPGHVYIHEIGSEYGPGSVGLKEMRTLIPALREHFPNMKTYGGFRATGARWGPAMNKKPGRLSPQKSPSVEFAIPENQSARPPTPREELPTYNPQRDKQLEDDLRHLLERN